VRCRGGLLCASSDDYVAIFTPKPTGALKLLGESYLFGVLNFT